MARRNAIEATQVQGECGIDTHHWGIGGLLLDDKCA